MRRWSARILTASLASALGLGIAAADTAPPASSAAQPVLPAAGSDAMPMSSPLLGGSSGGSTGKPLVVRKPVRRTAGVSRRRHRVATAEPLDRPALAGVQLIAPIPHPMQPPHFVVPVPAYPFENFITFYTTPPPPVVCARVPRDPYALDPHLVGERPVVCEADNP